MKKLFPALVALLGSTTLTFAEAGGDPERGEEIFRQCVRCHMVGDGAFNRTGPHLNNIFDRAVAQVEGFRYSSALKEASESGMIWDHETLDAFLTNPRSVIPGTRMSFRGLSEQQDRDDVLAYVRQFSANPSNIPEAAPTAEGIDHDIDPVILEIVGDPAYGEYLSSECTTCHNISGADTGIPNIIGWPTEDFVVVLHQFKSGDRQHEVMQMIANRLSNEEIAALAAYFAGLE